MEETETVRRGSKAEQSIASSGKDKVITMNGMTGYRYDENDDMAPIMDTILKRLATKRIEGPIGDEWIGGAGHRDMEDALEVMMPKEREIIKKYFVEDKTLMDISIEMNMAMDLVGGYIQSAKAQIMLWM